MYSGLLIILLPLIVGYLIPLRHRPLLVLINRLLSWMVYVILFSWVSAWHSWKISAATWC